MEEGELVVHESGNDQIHHDEGEPEDKAILDEHGPGEEPPGAHGLHVALSHGGGGGEFVGVDTDNVAADTAEHANFQIEERRRGRWKQGLDFGFGQRNNRGK